MRVEASGAAGTAACRLAVLLVEDNPGDAELARISLEGATDPAVTVVEVASLAAAEAAIARHAFGAVVLDLDLPDSRGLDTLAAMLGVLSGQPVVVLTGLDDDRSGLAAVRAGAQDFLPKNELAASPGTLRRALRYAVERTRERRASEERIHRLNRLLRTTSEINQMVVRERDRERVVAEACRIAVEHGGFAAACGARVGPDGGVELVACAGEAEQCAECAGGGAGRPASGCGPLGVAIREERPVLVADIAADDAHPPVWVRRALDRGFGTAAALPVRLRGEVSGGFVVYGEADNAITTEEMGLLAEIADDIGFALETIDNQRLLRDSERRYRLLFERNLAGVYRTTTAGEILECNDEFARIFGHASAQAMLGLRAEETFRSPGARREFLDALREDGELRGYETVGVRADGTAISVLENATLVEDPASGETWIEGSVIDISEHKRTEEQLHQAQKLEAVGRLAGGVAHDFNNLLQAGMGMADVLRMRAGDAGRTRELAEELAGLLERGAALTRQLLLFARRERSVQRSLDLDEVVRGVSRMLRRLLRETVDLQLDLAGGGLGLVGDRGQLEQVLVNLALNAADAMPDGGRLTIRTGTEGGGTVWLELEDTGSGIPPEVRPRLFEPFFTTKGPDRGTGLGLAVVHGIVTAHGGGIEVDSEVGRGSTFRVRLPARAGREPDHVASRDRDDAVPQGSGEEVLVVEDQEAVREGLSEILRHLGYGVRVAGSAEDALALAAGNRVDLLLTDLVLPGESGVELARRMRAAAPELPVIVMSGYSEEHSSPDGLAAEEIRYLSKPFSARRLASVVRDALGTTRPG